MDTFSFHNYVNSTFLLAQIPDYIIFLVYEAKNSTFLVYASR